MNQPKSIELTERIRVIEEKIVIVGIPEFEIYLKSNGWFPATHAPTMWRRFDGHSQVITVEIGHLEKAIAVVAEFEKITSAKLHAKIMGILQ